MPLTMILYLLNCIALTFFLISMGAVPTLRDTPVTQAGQKFWDYQLGCVVMYA